jgi:hypothetical protein
MTRAIALLVFCAGCATGSTPKAPLNPLNFLVGQWVSCNGEQQTFETWTLEGAHLTGTNRTVRDGEQLHSEGLTIQEQKLGYSYIASPQGQATTAFALMKLGKNHARFQNAKHDYPQVIEYRRDGNTLTATISRSDGSKSRSRRFGLGQCPATPSPSGRR